MKFRTIAAMAAAICAISCVSCGDKKDTSLTVSENSDGSPAVGELITPSEGSEEYNLGQYRMSSTGVKLYYDDEEVPEELVHALEAYFLTFQNDDFDSYKELLFPDYAERYEEFLQKEYKYSLDKSFQLNREKLCKVMANERKEHDESLADSDPSGEFKITRIKAQRPDLTDGTPSDLMMQQEATEATTKSEEELKKEAFSYFDEVFGIDYYDFVQKNSDDIEYLNFYIYASDEDGDEFPLIGDIDIVFAVKDGKYYTFG